MKKTITIIASCGLASGLAIAQAQDTEGYDQEHDATTESHESSEYGTMDSTSSSDPMAQTTADDTDEMGDMMDEDTDVAELSVADLDGKTISTATGEEIGEIDEVWSSSGENERVALVEVGGFLGVGEKTIAIPLSDLQPAASGDGYVTSMTRESIEAHPEFDETGYTQEDDAGDDTGY